VYPTLCCYIFIAILADLLLSLLSPQNYLLNVTFIYGEDDELVEFDKRGDPPGR